MEWLVWSPLLCLTHATKMFTEAHAKNKHADIKTPLQKHTDTFSQMLHIHNCLSKKKCGVVKLYLSWAWRNHCYWFFCSVNIYKHLLSGKGHSFHTGRPPTTCKKQKYKLESLINQICVKVCFLLVLEQDWQLPLLYLRVTSRCLVSNSLREYDGDC